MDVYKKTNSPYWYFAPTLSVGGARRQHPISTYLKDQRAAREVMRKTVLLAESVEAQVPLTPELRRWLEAMNPKLRKKLVALGLVDDRDAAAADSIEQHVEDYLADCLANGHGNDFVKTKRSQLRSMLKHTAAKRLSDLTPDAVSRFLASLIEAGKSHRTRNQHRASAVSWLNWCVDRGRLDGHRVNRIGRLNENLDRRRHRRAATDDEIERLFEVMPEHRRFVFLGAVFTGLRRGEMNRVEWRDIDLEKGTLRVRAEVDKEDKEVRVPIHPALAEALEQRRGEARPTDLVFKPVPTMDTIRRDLAKAGIDYKDADGLQLDFHALRSTFATRLLRSGISTSVAIRFTRHASVRTLEQHYDKLGLSDAMDALPKLPDIGGL